MNYVMLNGGLGNQMFQYSFGEYLKEKGLPVSYFQTKMDSNRIFRLNSVFDLEISLKKVTSIKRKFIKSVSLIPFLKYEYLTEDNFSLKYLKEDKKNYLVGYWHNINYINEINDYLKKQFSLKDKLSHLEGYLVDGHCTSVHIRRGDYINDQEVNKKFNILGENYYKRATEVITNKVPNTKFYIFSDDIDWVKNSSIINSFKNYIIVDDDLSDYEELFLMSQCKSNIIANSTFSWWGAWLNDSIEKIVVAPRYWYKSDRQKNIFYDNCFLL